MAGVTGRRAGGAAMRSLAAVLESDGRCFFTLPAMSASQLSKKQSSAPARPSTRNAFFSQSISSSLSSSSSCGIRTNSRSTRVPQSSGRCLATVAGNSAAQELYNRHRQIFVLNDKEPDIAVDAFVAPNATVIGDVEVQDRATIWYGCVLRGDMSKIKIGFYSNIQDKTVIHSTPTSPLSPSASETVIGKYVSVGVSCSLRGCTIEDEVVIGDRCVVMEGSVLEKNAVLGSGSVVPPGRLIPSKQLWAGVPACYVRNLTHDEIVEIPKLSIAMTKASAEHSSEFLPYSTAYLEAEKLKETLAGSAQK